jgi:hypothetical protein
MVVEDSAATQQETVVAFVEASDRRGRAAPLRRQFVQGGRQGVPVPGPLSAMVRSRDEIALDLYLLHRARASSAPFDVATHSAVWARAVGLSIAEDLGSAAVSKVWRRLDEKYKVVRRERRGRIAKIIALREDGSGRPYEIPSGSSWNERYFKIPFAYWLDPESWHSTLSLRGKAALLIALSLPSPFILPSERAPAWYGISADTLERGLHELTALGVLGRVLKVRKAPLAPAGKTRVAEYRRLGAFAPLTGHGANGDWLRIVAGTAATASTPSVVGSADIDSLAR